MAQHDPTVDLIARARGGDREALDHLMDRYYERVRKIVRLRLGPRLRNALESADILQETFLTAADKFDSFEPRDEASLINWLAKLAQHKITDAADFHGSQKRDLARRVPLEPAGDGGTANLAAEPMDSGPSPSQVIQHAEQQRLVEDCMAELPESYRELILLRNYVGAGWESIAQQTGRPSQAAARMMHAKAMIELGKLMRKKAPPTTQL